MTAALEEIAAAADALATYLGTVLPEVRRELGRWRREAEAIPDLRLRRHAVAALEEKGDNVEAVAVLAITAPPACRAIAVRAIAALQISIDYLDTLEEDAIEPDGTPGDGGYLLALQRGWREAALSLPAAARLLPLVEAAAERCAAGQRHTHAAAAGDVEGLRRWAGALPRASGYRWWEAAAGASSSVAAHALIAAAADPRAGVEVAEATDAAYFPAVGALTVLLDDLVDREADLAAGEHNYLAYYDGPEEAAERLAAIGRDATAAVARLPRRRRHAAILAGVAAFYLSAPTPDRAYGAPIQQRLLAALGPGTGPLVAFMRLRQLR